MSASEIRVRKGTPGNPRRTSFPSMLVDERLLVVKTLGLLIELRGLVPGLELPPLRLIHLIGHRIISMTAKMRPVYTDIGKESVCPPLQAGRQVYAAAFLECRKYAPARAMMATAATAPPIRSQLVPLSSLLLGSGYGSLPA